MTYDFKIVNCDTDSISFCKQDGSQFSQEEQQALLNDINSQLPELIEFTNDGYFKTVLVIKTKNYIMDDGKKLKVKGSALKAKSKEPALKEFIDKIIEYLLNDKKELIIDLYHKYVKEAMNVTDIKRWASRKTISSKTIESTRTNESKIMDALGDDEFSEGDRVHMFFKQDESLSTIDNFDGIDYNKDKLLEKTYKTLKTFETVLDFKSFVNYKLKRSKKLLGELLNENS